MMKLDVYLKKQNVRFSLKRNKAESFLFFFVENKSVKTTGWCIIFISIYKMMLGKIIYLWFQLFKTCIFNNLGGKRFSDYSKFWSFQFFALS